MNDTTTIGIRSQRVLTALSMILISLGIGNLYFGSHKERHYTELVSLAEKNLANPRRSIFPLIDPTIDTDREQQHIRRLKGSQQFYHFVQKAGLWMLFLGLMISIASLLLPAKHIEDLSTSNETN
jgi:hypothetical protein